MTQPETQPAPLDAEGVKAILTPELSALETRLTKTLTDAVADAVKPLDRSKLPTGDAPSGVRIVDTRAHLYERIKRTDPELAIYRTPDADYWSAHWLRASAGNDHVEMARAHDEIRKIYGRATLVESTPPAAGSGLSPGSAGSILPLPLAGAIQLALNKRAKIRNLPNGRGPQVFQSEGKILRVPTATVATTAMTAEGATATQGEPTLATVILDKEKQQGQFGVSKETLRDSAFDLAGFFAERAGSAFAEQEDSQICTSNGTSPNISGAIINGVTDVAEASAGTLTYADLVTFIYTLPEQYMQNATLLVASNVAGFLSRLSYTSGGIPVLVPIQGAVGLGGTIGDGAHVIGTVMGFPTVIVPLAAGSAVFGDINKGYGLLDEPGVEVEMSTHAGWSTDSVLWKFTRRWDGQVLIADALRRFAGITAIG